MKFLTDREWLAHVKNVDIINKFMRSVMEFSEDQEQHNKSAIDILNIFKETLINHEQRLQELETHCSIVNVKEEISTPPKGKKGGLDGLH